MKTLRLPVRFLGVGAVGLLLCFAQGVVGQQQYESWQVWPVTFYDFHSDRSNPEFEQPHGKYNNSSTTARPGMVQDLLDADGKPQASHPSNGGYLNQGIRFWFRDWNNLPQYKMAAATYKDPINTSRGYLEKFRPIYMYGNTQPPKVGIGTSWGDEWNNNSYEWKKNAYVASDFDGLISGGNMSIDSAFKNKVIKGNLYFSYVPGSSGKYKFSQVNFFPLNALPGQAAAGYNANGRNPGVTFDNTTTDPLTTTKWSSVGNTQNNYAFTMEMACEFKMEPGLQFDFKGDDDVWVFINNKLALDIGGIHEAVEKNVNLDNLRNTHGLKDGDKYNFHMFYAERHSEASNITITTNIMTARVDSLKIKVDGSSMEAGKPKLASGEIMTDEGRLKDFSKGNFTWTARDEGGYNTLGTTLTVSSATSKPLSKTDSVNVIAQKAYTWVWIIGSYYDSVSLKRVWDSTRVWVGPGPAAKLYVEPTADSSESLRASNKIDTIRINGADTTNSNFYAILRDQYDNWVGPAVTTGAGDLRTITWVVDKDKESIATAAKGPNPARGQGLATRAKGVNTGTAPFTVTYNVPSTSSTWSAKATIKLEDVTYKAVEVGIKQGGTFIPLSSSATPNTVGTITLTVGADTMLYVRLQRPDGTWDEAVPAAWAVSNVPGFGTPSGNVSSWRTGKTTGSTQTGTVKVTVPTNVSFTGNREVTVNIKVVYRDPVVARFFYKTGTPVFTPEITTLEGTRPTTARMYVAPSATVTLVAGEPMPIVGKLFASTTIDASTWLHDSVIINGAGKWTWSFVPGSGPSEISTDPSRKGVISDNPTLRGGLGDSITFTSTVATYESKDYYKIRGTYVDASKNITIVQEVWIRVIPNTLGAKLYIEPNNQGQTLSPNVPQKLAEIVFTSSQKTGSTQPIYAVIRDKYGNYICPSGAANPYPPPTGTGNTAWSTLGAPSVTVAAGYAPWGEGIVTRAGSDSTGTKVVAYDNIWAVRDTVPVRFLGYDYEDIKIVTECVGGTIIAGGKSYCEISDTLWMNSNEDKQIYVVGQRDDTHAWEPITGDWSRESSLMDALGTPPSGTGSWTLSPDGTGKGQITVTGPNGKKDTIDVVITVGPPLRAELVVLTPADRLIAGQPIEAKINYYNRAGLMTEWDPSWGNPGAYFNDNVGVGVAVNYPPTVTSEAGNRSLCNPDVTCSGPNASLAHNPTNLNDVVTFVIYNVAEHQITYKETINGVDITAATKITLKPGDAKRLEIVGDGVNNDTLKINVGSGGEDVILRVIAYDEYGNKIGEYPSNWNSGNPIPIDIAGRPVILYPGSTATGNGSGQLCATDPNNPNLGDCITVQITGVTERPLSAITRDSSGSGYLDRIDFKFKKPIKFADGSTGTKTGEAVKGKIEVVCVGGDAACRGDGTTPHAWTIESVSVNPADSTVRIWLEDKSEGGALQTAWTPTVKIKTNDLFTEAGTQDVKTTDGAAPVIKSAKFYFGASGKANSKDNFIKVEFSERVVSVPDATQIGLPRNTGNAKIKPEMLFNIWKRGSDMNKGRTRALSKTAADDGRFNLADDALAGIDTTIYVDDYSLSFYLRNEKELGPPSNYINIRTSPAKYVQDVPLNADQLTERNRKVPITLGNQPNNDMKAIPNPASPDDKRVPAGIINATNDATALDYIKAGGGGAVFEVPIYMPKTPGAKIKCQLKVYDLAGNLVVSGQSDKVKDGLTAEPGNPDKMYLYWNGYNAKKMKVAPGTYRMVVLISYDLPSNAQSDDRNDAKNKKFTGLVGISK